MYLGNYTEGFALYSASLLTTYATGHVCERPDVILYSYVGYMDTYVRIKETDNKYECTYVRIFRYS